MRILKLAIGLAAFFVLGFAAIHLGGAERMRERLAAQGDAALAAAGEGWAGVEIENGVAAITGAPPDEEAGARAAAALLATPGYGGAMAPVSSVALRLSPPAAVADLRWRAILTSEGLELTGVAPGETARRAVAREAGAQFDGEAVLDYVVAAGEGDGAAWADAVGRALRALSLLDEGEIKGRGRRFTLTGRTDDPARAAGAARTMETIAPPYEGASEIVVAPQGEPETADADSPREDAVATLISRFTEESPDAPTAPPPDERRRLCQEEIDALFDAKPVSFISGDVVIPTSAIATIERAAQRLLDCGDIAVMVEGHTDSIGSERDNAELSAARAASVADALKARGVPASRLSARGLGEAEPVATNDTAAGRALNRRIEILLSPAGSDNADEDHADE